MDRVGDGSRRSCQARSDVRRVPQESATGDIMIIAHLSHWQGGRELSAEGGLARGLMRPLKGLLETHIFILFKRVIHNDLHVLQPLLPAKTSFSYNLRPRHHNRQLPRKSAYVNDSCFITRMLHSNSY